MPPIKTIEFQNHAQLPQLIRAAQHGLAIKQGEWYFYTVAFGLFIGFNIWLKDVWFGVAGAVLVCLVAIHLIIGRKAKRLGNLAIPKISETGQLAFYFLEVRYLFGRKKVNREKLIWGGQSVEVKAEKLFVPLAISVLQRRIPVYAVKAQGETEVLLLEGDYHALKEKGLLE